MCFIGHGAFGIITKPVWCNYFAVFGIGHDLAYRMMPVVGCFDILLGIVMLIYPMRAIPAWLVVWGIVTALLRPLSGEPFAEFIERAGNYGAPLALLLLSGLPRNTRGWFSRTDPSAPVEDISLAHVTRCLKIVSSLLLLGHGWLNLSGKPALLAQYASLGFSNPAQVAQVIGLAEIAAAFVVLIKPFRAILFVFFMWKMVSELFYPHYALFEWIERGGSYGALLALWIITKRPSGLKDILARKFSSQKALRVNIFCIVSIVGVVILY